MFQFSIGRFERSSHPERFYRSGQAFARPASSTLNLENEFHEVCRPQISRFDVKVKLQKSPAVRNLNRQGVPRASKNPVAGLEWIDFLQLHLGAVKLKP
jgi:hypothetical protein